MAHRTSISAVVLAVLLATCPAAAAYSGQLKRYPYLTDAVDVGASGHVTVNWATDRSATTGSIRWGEVAADGTCVPASAAPATRTSISVSGVSEYQWKAPLTLVPGREYCYRPRLGELDLLAGDPSPRFRTQVPAGSSERFSFAV